MKHATSTYLILRLAIWLVISVLGLMIIYPYKDGFDSVIFQIVGQRLLLDDGVIYSDVFDHKGPMIFIINALGLSFPYAMELLTVITTAVSLEMAWRISRLLCRARFVAVVSVLATTVFFFCTMAYNSTEQWSVVFSFIALYIGIRGIVRKELILSRRDVVILGICLAVTALTRVNNCIFPLAVAAFYLFSYIPASRRQNLVPLLLWGIGGMAIVCIPISVYLIVNGAFGDMVYDSITYNLIYLGGNKIVHNHNLNDWIFSLLYRLPIWITAMSAIVGIIWNKFNKNMAWLGLLTAVVSIVAIGFHMGYLHYYAILTPMIPLAVCFTALLAANQIVESLSALIVAFICLFIPVKALKACIDQWQTTKISLDMTDIPAKRGEYKSLIDSLIQSSERDSVYLHYTNVTTMYAIRDLGIKPYGRYFHQQDYHAKSSDIIRDSIEHTFRDNPPRWVISRKSSLNDSSTIYPWLYKYTVVHPDSDFTILKLKN